MVKGQRVPQRLLNFKFPWLVACWRIVKEFIAGLALLVHPHGRNSSESRVLITKGKRSWRLRSCVGRMWRPLQPEVGSVPLEEVVEAGCRHYVLNFEDYLLDPQDQTPVKPPRVLVPPDGLDEFCSQLLNRRVFLWCMRMMFIRWVAAPC